MLIGFRVVPREGRNKRNHVILEIMVTQVRIIIRLVSLENEADAAPTSLASQD